MQPSVAFLTAFYELLFEVGQSFKVFSYYRLMFETGCGDNKAMSPFEVTMRWTVPRQVATLSLSEDRLSFVLREFSPFVHDRRQRSYAINRAL